MEEKKIVPLPKNPDRTSSKDVTTKAINEAIENENLVTIKKLVTKTHYADLADYINFANHEQRLAVIKLIDQSTDPLILLEFEPDILKSLIQILGFKKFAKIANILETDEIVSLLNDLPQEIQDSTLSFFPANTRRLILKALSYPKNSAGLLMQTSYISIEDNKTVGDTLDYIVGHEDLAEDCEEIFITNKIQKPVGILHISKLLRHKRNITISTIMKHDIQTIYAATDKEDVAYMFKHYDLDSAPVVDKQGKIVGVITLDQVLEIVEEEVEEDFMKIGGVRIGDLYSALLKTTTQRFPWLFFNLLTACLISFVISKFQNQIAQLAILAAIMPIVASMGGNAGTQSVTILIRAIVNKDITRYNTSQIVIKEIATCGLNGLVLGIIGGVILFFLYHETTLSLVFSMAVLLNFILAGIWGTMVPLTLNRLDLDPAIASGVFVTFLTDLLGFFIFLTLASILIL